MVKLLDTDKHRIGKVFSQLQHALINYKLITPYGDFMRYHTMLKIQEDNKYPCHGPVMPYLQSHWPKLTDQDHIYSV